MEWLIAIGVSLFGGVAYVVGFWRGRKVTERLILQAVTDAIMEMGWQREESTFILRGDENGFHVEEK